MERRPDVSPSNELVSALKYYPFFFGPVSNVFIEIFGGTSLSGFFPVKLPAINLFGRVWGLKLNGLHTCRGWESWPCGWAHGALWLHSQVGICSLWRPLPKKAHASTCHPRPRPVRPLLGQEALVERSAPLFLGVVVPLRFHPSLGMW